jgi:cbb3-type cytochrome oxidase subunit 1
VRVKFPGVLITGAVFWQVGLTYGIINIFAGKTTGLEGLEIPTGSAVLMLIGYLLIVLWAFVLYSFRSQTKPFISVWYLIAALLWFPWSFAVAHAAHLLPNVSGVMQGLVAAWASQNFLNIWLTAIGLATAYYLIPKVISRHVHSYSLASIGFWSFIVFAGLTGAVRLSGGPIPAWVVTLSIAASIILLVQIVTVTTNLVKTMRGQYHMVYHSPTIRFTFFGAIAWTISSSIGLLTSLRSVDSVVHFTPFQTGQMMLAISCLLLLQHGDVCGHVLYPPAACRMRMAFLVDDQSALLGLGLRWWHARGGVDAWRPRYWVLDDRSHCGLRPGASGWLELPSGHDHRVVPDCRGPLDIRPALPAHALAHRPAGR